MNPDKSGPVLVVGAGGAGLIAAAVAARAGAQVTVLSKAPPGLGNCTTYAGGGFTLGVGGVSPERHRAMTAETGRGLNVPELLDALAFGAPEAVPGLADFGVRIEVRRGGAFVRSHERGRGLMGGTGLTLPLVEHCRQAGVEFDDRFFASAVAVEDGRATGLVGVDLRTGRAEWRPAAAVILATGGAGRLYGRTDNPVRTTGDGYVMAFQAGLELLDMEFVQFYPLGFAEPGGPVWMIGLEITDQVPLTNSHGVPFLERLLPQWGLKSGREANLFARDRAARAVAAEWAEGRQVLLHFETLSEKDWKEPYFAALGHFYPAGFDRSSRPVRVAPVEHYFTGGVRIDDHGRTAIPGLFACGEVTGGTDGASRVGGNALSQLAVFGVRAGEEAAGHAAAAGPFGHGRGDGSTAAPPGTAADEVARLSAAIGAWRRNAGLARSPAVLRRELNALNDKLLGPLRDGSGLRAAMAELEEMASRVKSLAVTDNRQLLEALELGNLILVARMVAAAATAREESRGVHYRTDFPNESPDWLRHLGVTAGPRGEVRVKTCDVGAAGLPADGSGQGSLKKNQVVPLAWRALQATGVVKEQPLRVLFLCAMNSTRSQMAEGLARWLSGGRVAAASAGLEATRVDPRAVAVVAELDVDLSRQSSKVVDGEMLRDTDLVITLCDPARDRCPVLPPGVARRHWPIRSLDALSGSEVPEDVWRPAYRAVRDDLRARIEGLLDELGQGLSPGE